MREQHKKVPFLSKHWTLSYHFVFQFSSYHEKGFRAQSSYERVKLIIVIIIIIIQLNFYRSRMKLNRKNGSIWNSFKCYVSWLIETDPSHFTCLMLIFAFFCNIQKYVWWVDFLLSYFLLASFMIIIIIVFNKSTKIPFFIILLKSHKKKT